MKIQRFFVVLVFIIAISFSMVVIAFADSNTPAEVRSPSLNESEMAWWVKSLFAGLVSALIIILAFGLDRLVEWSKSKKIKKEFLESSCAELRHLLACLVIDYGKMKVNIDGFSGADFKWTIKSYKEFGLDNVTDPLQEQPPMPEGNIDDLSDDELQVSADILNKRLKRNEDAFTHLTQLNLGFIENNLHMISSLGSGTQQLLFSTINRIRSINVCIGELDQEYDHSFHFANDNNLINRIHQNKKIYYKCIASISYQASNEIMKFLRENWMPCTHCDKM